MDGKGQPNTILITQKEREVCHEKKADGDNDQIDHCLDQATLIFPPRKQKNDNNDQIDGQHQTKRKKQLHHVHGNLHKQNPFLFWIISLGILRYDLIEGLQYPALRRGIGVKSVDVPSNLAYVRYYPFRQRQTEKICHL